MNDLPEWPERFGGYYGDGDGYDEPGWSRYDDPSAASYRTPKLGKLKVVLDKPATSDKYPRWRCSCDRKHSAWVEICRRCRDPRRYREVGK